MSQPQQPGTAYRATFNQATQEPEAFWQEQAAMLDWHTPPTRSVDYDGAVSWPWFPDGKLRITYQALDRWGAAGRGGQPALIWDSAVTPHQVTCTYARRLHRGG